VLADTRGREVEMLGSRNKASVLDDLLKDFDAYQRIHSS
jgi:hypothetical protein